MTFESFELVDAARKVLPDIAARRRKYDTEGSFPSEDFRDAAKAGLIYQAAPRKFGGRDAWTGGELTQMYAVNEVVASVDPSFAQVLQVNNHAYGVLAWHATPEQQEAIFPRLVDNALLVGIAGSEAVVGSSASGTRAAELQRTTDGWSLTTTKYFASLGPGASHFLVMAAIPGDSPYNERQVFVLVPTDAEQVSLENSWDTLGMRATVSWNLRITDLPVADEDIIGEPGGWLRDPRSFTCGYISNHLGAADGAVRFVTDWLAERPVAAASEFSRVTLGDLSSRVATLRAAFRTVLGHWELAAANGWDSQMCNQAELESLQLLHVAKTESLYCISKAFEVCGARSIFRDHVLEQLLRDTRSFTLHSRDDSYMLRVASALLQPGTFTVKGLDIAPDGVKGSV